MDRGLKAAFLFSVLVVAQADRALTAHKPSTGGLHAVAVIRSTITTAVVPSTATIETTFSNVGNYMITNGNGTWTYSYYANNANLNGNDAGMGGDYVYPNNNIAWYNSNAIAGTLYPASGAYIAALVLPSYDDTTTAGGVAASTQIESPLAAYSVGITSMVFTGSKTGIAVGRYGGFHDYDETYAAATVAALAQNGQAKFNILLTYDGATTWSRATGVPKASRVPVASFVAGTAGGAAAAPPPYPTVTVGDLTSVFFASKTLGWAVGGNDVALAQACSSVAALGPVTGSFSNSLAATIAGVQPLGLVLMTQNGGSLWKLVPIWTGFASLNSLWVNNDPSLKNIFNTPIPGILFGVQSDASGKHVYAVGSGSTMYYKGAGTAASPYLQLTDNAAPITAVKIYTYGTILYSGNSGMSWVQQTAPTLYSGTVPYALFEVAVQKGTTAVAVGGSPFIKYGDKSAGTIIYTTNGGFSWTQAVYPQSTGSKAPVFSAVALQPSMSGSSTQTVWVGGYTTRTDQALAKLAVATKAVDFYPVAAVTGFTPTTATPVTYVGSNVQRAKGQIYTILVSKDGGKTFAAAPTAGLPTGYVVTSYTHATTDSLVTDRSVYGITWDNAMHGWIYGYGYIMSTQDGGVTWVYETPADVGVTTVTPRVTTIASVPTTY